ncbi:MAG: radical SAM protein [Campylobacterota bacterium]|nr:radical SAM protein [Campylobacterota bacterium]
MNKYKIDDITFSISNYCPGKCLNCNIYQVNPRLKDEIELKMYEKILQSKIVKDTFYFSLTGGEAQLSPKFIPILDLLNKYKGNDCQIQTNISGWHFEQHVNIAEHAIQTIGKDNFRVDISVDGIEEYYNRVRLTDNGWAKVEKTTNALKNLGIQITYVMIVHKQNYKGIKSFIDLCKNRGVRWYINFSVERGTFNNKGKVEYFDESEITYIEEQLENIGFLNTKHYVNWEWAKAIYRNKMPIVNCSMGSRSIVIDPHGNVLPCAGGQEDFLKDILSMGNLKDFSGDLDSLLYSDKALTVLDNIKQKKCQPCKLLCAHKIEFPWGKGTGL